MKRPFDIELSKEVEYVLGRFGACPKGEFDLQKVANEQSVPLDFLVQIIVAFGDTRLLYAQQFNEYSIELLVDYLVKSHNYYRSHYIPQLYQELEKVTSVNTNQNHLCSALCDFLMDYSEHLNQHFDEEEAGLFPYALYLNKIESNGCSHSGDKRINYDLGEFVQEHNHDQGELGKVRQAFRTYLPSQQNDVFTPILKLFRDFEVDLHVHGFIEDHVLVPKLMSMENRLKLMP